MSILYEMLICFLESIRRDTQEYGNKTKIYEIIDVRTKALHVALSEH